MISLWRHRLKPKVIIFDVDGVLTDRRFIYGARGKVYKLFGADDHDALKVLSKYLEVIVISADRQGFSISKRRVTKDFGFRVFLVSGESRVKWISDRYNMKEAIYMGDGFYDYRVFEMVGYAIAPGNALKHTRDSADYVTESTGGMGAVAEACLHILDKFFKVKFSNLADPNGA
jgi:3-deoxy-D-manno-octulosonate 8-phosphate phosphatase (KDO 8-P phosphatase)